MNYKWVWEFVWTNLPFEKSFPSSTSPCAPFSPISLKNTRDGVPDLDSGPVVTSTKYNTPKKKQTLFPNVNLTLLKKNNHTEQTSKLRTLEYFIVCYRWFSLSTVFFSFLFETRNYNVIMIRFRHFEDKNHISSFTWMSVNSTCTREHYNGLLTFRTSKGNELDKSGVLRNWEYWTVQCSNEEKVNDYCYREIRKLEGTKCLSSIIDISFFLIKVTYQQGLKNCHCPAHRQQIQPWTLRSMKGSYTYYRRETCTFSSRSRLRRAWGQM